MTEMERIQKWNLLKLKNLIFSLLTKYLSHCKATKPHMLSEDGVKPDVVDMAHRIFWDSAARQTDRQDRQCLFILHG